MASNRPGLTPSTSTHGLSLGNFRSLSRLQFISKATIYGPSFSYLTRRKVYGRLRFFLFLSPSSFCLNFSSRPGCSSLPDSFVKKRPAPQYRLPQTLRTSRIWNWNPFELPNVTSNLLPDFVYERKRLDPSSAGLLKETPLPAGSTSMKDNYLDRRKLAYGRRFPDP